jgi:hypothetical protein
MSPCHSLHAFVPPSQALQEWEAGLKDVKGGPARQRLSERRQNIAILKDTALAHDLITQDSSPEEAAAGLEAAAEWWDSLQANNNRPGELGSLKLVRQFVKKLKDCGQWGKWLTDRKPGSADKGLLDGTALSATGMPVAVPLGIQGLQGEELAQGGWVEGRVGLQAWQFSFPSSKDI